MKLDKSLKSQIVETKFPKKPSIGFGRKALSVMTSVLATPISVVHGFIATIQNCGKLYHAIFDDQSPGVVDKQVLQNRDVEQLHGTSAKFHPNKPTSVANIIHGIIVSLLRMVPFLGMQLAEHYDRRNTLSGFLDTPAFTSFITTHNLEVQQIIYNDSDRAKIKPKVNEIESALKVYSAGTCKNVEIPHENGKRSHEATLIIGPHGREDAPVVIMSHPNAESRTDCNWPPFLNKGYNILLVDYAGDYNSNNPIPCSETAMREDAEADIKYVVNTLKSKEIGFYGLSLGGAHAANHAQILSKLQGEAKDGDPIKDVKIPFLFLDQTFSSNAEAAESVVVNRTKSKLIGSLVGQTTHAEAVAEHQRTPDCDGLNTASKLAHFEKTSGFTETKIIIVGAKSDSILGGETDGKFDSTKNLSHLLDEAANNRFEGKVSHIMIEALSGGMDPAGHCAPFSADRLVIEGKVMDTNPILQAIPQASTLS